MEKVKIEYGGEEVVMAWDGSQASAPILVDGDQIGRQTADARHRRTLAVAIAARHAWPTADWPAVPSTGSIPMENFGADSEAWDDLSYATVEG